MDTSIHPFRICVFGTAVVTKGKGKRQRTERQGYGFDLWNPDEETAERAGRPGFGSFEWYGMHLARCKALDQFADPQIDQVQIRTNGDQTVFVFYRSKLDQYLGQSRIQFAA